MNQRNSRLYCVCSISWRSERIEYSTCSSMARSSFSGATLGRPPLMSSSYIWANRSPISARALLTIVRITRSGWLAGTKSSSFLSVNRPSVKVSAPRMRVSLQVVEVLRCNASRHWGVDLAAGYFSHCPAANFNPPRWRAWRRSAWQPAPDKAVRPR